jgi:hypothetical protein
MTTQIHTISDSGLVNAPAEQVYALLADYRHGHPQVLPKQYFSNLTVDHGGIGAGTLIRFQMTGFGRTQKFRAEITEPEPGRVLVETDLDTGVVTTFTISPLEQGRSQVTISTIVKSRAGLLGAVERFMTTQFLRRVYAAELKLIAQVAQERAGASSTKSIRRSR